MSRTLDMHKNKSLVKCRSLRVTVREKGALGPNFFLFLVDLSLFSCRFDNFSDHGRFYICGNI